MSDLMDRRGSFHLSWDWMEGRKRDDWTALMHTVFVFYAQPRTDGMGGIDYFGVSDQFSALAEAAPAPWYEPQWNREEGRFIWRHV